MYPQRFMYDYSKLKGKITECCGTQYAFADKMGFSERTTSLKLTNKSSWTQPEMEKALYVLGVEQTGDNIASYFFSK